VAGDKDVEAGDDVEQKKASAASSLRHTAASAASSLRHTAASAVSSLRHAAASACAAMLGSTAMASVCCLMICVWCDEGGGGAACGGMREGADGWIAHNSASPPASPRLACGAGLLEFLECGEGGLRFDVADLNL
jgi:hypothetical protein